MKKIIVILLIAALVLPLTNGFRIAECEVVEDDDLTGYYTAVDQDGELWEFDPWLCLRVGEEIYLVYFTYFTDSIYDDAVIQTYRQ